jgi:hypothetical protein
MAELSEAIKAVTILQVADYLGIQGLKLGMNKSPFRPVKSGEPFSIFKQGYAFKDHGNDEHRGNSWKFLELARPGMPKKERAEIIFKLANMEPDSNGYSKNAFRRMKKESRKAAYKARASEFLKLKEFDAPADWSATVKARWDADAQNVPLQRLATSRGWPLDWCEQLVALNKVSFPWMPWADHKFKKARHGLAFKVEAPVFQTGKWTGMHPTGYHQQWLQVIDGVRKKDWLFIPHVPRKASTDFQRALMVEENRTTPFPFVLGEQTTRPNVIITEGQWDAISIYGAAGWFSAPPAAAVFGLRGAQSVEVFLAFYGRWIRATRPSILLLPDNDAAGRKWIDREDDNKIIPKPTFAERLQAWGARSVVFRSIDPKYGKDFNDYYKARQPAAADIIEWLQECGLAV